MRVASRGKAWSRDELIVACNLYFSLPFGQMHARNPAVIAMARALGRTPGSVAMKLVNLASLDAAHQARGISGLTGVSRADKEIWQEFGSNWSVLAAESEKRLREILSAKGERPEKEPAGLRLLTAHPEGPTEAAANVRVRIMQASSERLSSQHTNHDAASLEILSASYSSPVTF